MIAGLGCKKGIAAGEVLAALDAALHAYGLSRDRLAALAVVPQKADERALTEVAHALQRPLHVAGLTELETARSAMLTSSEASLAATGFGSASEAAALAVAGKGARLLGPRITLGAVSCAIAVKGDAS